MPIKKDPTVTVGSLPFQSFFQPAGIQLPLLSREKFQNNPPLGRHNRLTSLPRKDYTSLINMPDFVMLPNPEMFYKKREKPWQNTTRL